MSALERLALAAWLLGRKSRSVRIPGVRVEMAESIVSAISVRRTENGDMIVRIVSDEELAEKRAIRIVYMDEEKEEMSE